MEFTHLNLEAGPTDALLTVSCSATRSSWNWTPRPHNYIGWFSAQRGNCCLLPLLYTQRSYMPITIFILFFLLKVGTVPCNQWDCNGQNRPDSIGATFWPTDHVDFAGHPSGIVCRSLTVCLLSRCQLYHINQLKHRACGLFHTGQDCVNWTLVRFTNEKDEKMQRLFQDSYQIEDM